MFLAGTQEIRNQPGHAGIKKIIIIAQQRQKEARRRRQGDGDPRFFQHLIDAQDRQRQPLDGRQLQMSVAVGQVVAAEGEDEPGGKRTHIGSRSAVRQQERRPSAGREGEQNHHVVRLHQRHESQQADARQAVENAERVAPKRCSARVVLKRRIERQLVKLRDRLVDPPDVPDILQPIAGVAKKGGGKDPHQRPGHRQETCQVKCQWEEYEARQLPDRRDTAPPRHQPQGNWCVHDDLILPPIYRRRRGRIPKTADIMQITPMHVGSGTNAPMRSWL